MMKTIEQASEFEIMKATQEVCDVYEYDAPTPEEYRQFLPTIRRLYGALNLYEIRDAFDKYQAGEYRITGLRTKGMNAKTLSAVLGEHNRHRQTRKMNKTWEERPTKTPPNYEEIMSDGWKFQKELLLRDANLGWRFLSSLYSWASMRGKIKEFSHAEVQSEISRLAELFENKRRNTKDATKSFIEAANLASDNEKKDAAVVALSMKIE